MLSVDEFMSCRLGMNDSVWRIHGNILTGEKEELDENQCHFVHHKSPYGMTFAAKCHKIHASYGAVNTRPEQVGLQEGTVGHRRVASNAACCAHKYKTAPLKFSRRRLCNKPKSQHICPARTECSHSA